MSESALPAHYRNAGQGTGDDDLRPTPGIVTETESGDRATRSDMEGVHEHCRRRGISPGRFIKGA
jgi:hypothetical protein